MRTKSGEAPAARKETGRRKAQKSEATVGTDGKKEGRGKAKNQGTPGLKIRGRIVSRGIAEGVALVCNEALSFYGSIDFATGKVIEKGHPLFGRSIKDTVLVFPGGKGSTVGSYGLYRLRKSGLAPKAIINVETEPIIAAGAIISDIPLIDKLDADPLKIIKTGMRVKVDCIEGFVLLL